METIGIIVPVRSGSTRVQNKNTKPFANVANGLLELKLRQLIDIQYMGVEVVVSTNDPICKEVAESMGFKVHDRHPSLCTDETTAAQMIEHAADILNTETIMWVHVTSPFVDSSMYENIIVKYDEIKSKGTHDGLLTVLPFRNFLMNEFGDVVNANGKKWPRTQDLKVLYEVTHSVFMTSRQNHIDNKSRFGLTPYLYQLPKQACLDVDWPEDFDLAERIFTALGK